MENTNVVVVTGNLTRDPELREAGATSVCSLRIACNGRRKDGDQWVDKPNYFDVTVWGAQGVNIANHLSKGKKVGVTGRLDWREWEKDGQKRQAVEIVADRVEWLSPKDEGGQPQPQSELPEW